MKRSIGVIALLMVLVVTGCGGSEKTTSPTVSSLPTLETPATTIATAHGPVVVIRPQSKGPAGIAVQGEGNFGLGSILQDSESQAQGIPGGYILPARIHIYEMTGGKMKDYYLLVGDQDLPSERAIVMALTTEIRVGPLQEGTTKLILVQK